MSVTPPKWVQAAQERAESDLVSALRALADSWDAEAQQMREKNPPSADEASVRADVRARCLNSVAAEVRKLLEARGL